MNNKIILIVFGLMCLNLNILIAQNEEVKNVQRVVPPSPTVAALERYVDIPVSLYTGQPNISIPIWSVTEGNLAIPVTLSYHASGVKVEDIASWVGLGWSLNAGGVISRSVKGLPDDSNGYRVGFYYEGRNLKQYWDSEQQNIPPSAGVEYIFDKYGLPEPSRLDLLKSMELDGEPDEFYFNIAGFSGKFYFDNLGEIAIYSENDVKIEPIFSSTGSRIENWKVLLPNGQECWFGENGAHENSFTEDNWEFSTSPHVSAWKLTRIISQNKRDTIKFIYENSFQENFRSLPSEKYEIVNSNCATTKRSYSKSYPRNHSTGSRISQIQTKHVNVVFEANTSRTDVAGNSKRLDKVLVKRKDGTLLRTFTLGYSYFVSQKETKAKLPDGTEKYRLKLNQVEEMVNGTAKVTSFKYYNESDLPPRNVYAQDHWGYYNGIEASSFVSSFLRREDGALPLGCHYNPRTPKFPEMRAGTLESITYPTGGKTTFLYEPNDYARIHDMFPPVYHSSDKKAKLERIELRNFGQSQVTKEITTKVLGDNLIVNVLYRGLNEQYPSSGDVKIYDGSTLIRSIMLDDFDNEGRDGQDYTIEGVKNKNLRIVAKGSNVQIDVRLTDEFLIPVNEKRDIAGGLRVKEVHSFDGIQTLSKKYEYVTSYPGRGEISSGVLVNVPVYYFNPDRLYVLEDGRYNKVERIELGSSVSHQSQTQGSIVGYKEVHEIVQGSGRNIYKYTSGDQYFDKSYYVPIEGMVDRWKFTMDRPANYDLACGALKSKEVQDENGDPVYVTTYEYEHDLSNKIFACCVNNYYPSKIENVMGKPLDALVKKIDKFNLITGWHRIKSETTQFYGKNNSVPLTSSKEYIYGTSHQKPLQVVKQSTDVREKRIEKYWYAPDWSLIDGLSTAKKTVLQNMTDLNLIAEPVKTELHSLSGFLNGAENEYELVNGTYAIDKVKKLNPDHSIDQILDVNYYLNGNIKEMTKRDGMVETYLWGYDSKFPVAKFENATYADVDKVIRENSISWSESLSGADMQTLRSKLKKANVYFYTYDRVYGILSQVDPNGVSSTFNYDDFGRLKEVKDEDHKVVAHHEYHYANEYNANLSLSVSNLNYSSSSASTNVTVSSNTGWTVAENSSWISLSNGSGNNNGSFTISCQANNGAIRSDSVSVRAGNISKTIHITQSAGSTLVVNRSSVILDANGFPRTRVDVTSNSSWSLEVSDSWILLSAPSGSGNGYFYINSLLNGSTNHRTGIVTIRSGGKVHEIDVMQQGRTSGTGPGGEREIVPDEL